jgi:hypothetical protein
MWKWSNSLCHCMLLHYPSKEMVGKAHKKAHECGSGQTHCAIACCSITQAMRWLERHMKRVHNLFTIMKMNVLVGWFSHIVATKEASIDTSMCLFMCLFMSM